MIGRDCLLILSRQEGCSKYQRLNIPCLGHRCTYGHACPLLRKHLSLKPQDLLHDWRTSRTNYKNLVVTVSPDCVLHHPTGVQYYAARSLVSPAPQTSRLTTQSLSLSNDRKETRLAIKRV